VPRYEGNAYELFSLPAGLFAAMWPLSGMAFAVLFVSVCLAGVGVSSRLRALCGRGGRSPESRQSRCRCTGWEPSSS
jgi:hypothetical protein